MTTLNVFDGPRRGSTGGQKESEFLCFRCERPVWRGGGVSSLGRHLAIHGHAEVFPDFRLVDGAGYELDGYGERVMVRRKPVQAARAGDGWVRTRQSVIGVVSDRGSGPQ